MNQYLRSDQSLVGEAELLSVAGGSYISPPSDLKLTGRLLQTPGIDLSFPERGPKSELTFYCEQLFQALSGQLGHGEVLFALYYRNTFPIAPLLSHPADVARYELKDGYGRIRLREYYAMYRSLADSYLRGE